MTGGGGQDPRDQGAAGGPARHVPVLREEAIAALAPREGGLYIDGTLGAGGYSAAILAVPETRVVAIDRDPTAIRAGGRLVDEHGDRFTLVEGEFGDLDAIAARLGHPALDGVVLDIGVSSMQLDQAARGFSFRQDGPLDMRMAATGRTAADICNEASEETLADIFYYFGEERLSRRIARAIVLDRAAVPFTTTKALADLVGRLVPHKPTDIHPATRTFQALRIAVNDELGQLVAALAAAERALKPGGRLAVVTFHSLEDRIVKQFFAKRSGRGQSAGRRLPGEPEAIAPSFTLAPRQPIAPDDAERSANPRARSAKLRFGIRTDAPPVAVEATLRNLSLLPQSGRQP